MNFHHLVLTSKILVVLDSTVTGHRQVKDDKTRGKKRYEYETESYQGSSQALAFDIIFSFATSTDYLTNSESTDRPICNNKKGDTTSYGKKRELERSKGKIKFSIVGNVVIAHLSIYDSKAKGTN